MPLFKRISDGFWSLVSPRKTTAAQPKTPASAPPRFKKPTIPASRRHSLKHAVKNGRSMSPDTRVGAWQLNTPEDGNDITVTPSKRKQPCTPSTSGGPKKKKKGRFDSMDLESLPTLPADNEDNECNEAVSRLQIPSSPWAESTSSAIYQSDSEIVTDQEWEDGLARRSKKLELPEDDPMLLFSEDQLRTEGWDDDYIELKHRILMRGREPILPDHYKWDFRSLPDGLFCQESDAFLQSKQGKRMPGIKALQRLFEMGGYVRDGLKEEFDYTPEYQTLKFTNAYIKWANRDSGLDHRTAIPVLALVACPSHIDSADIENIARRKLAKLQDKYERAFRARPSIELSPSSTSNKLTHPVPQLFALVFSGPIAAMMAWRPDLEQDLHVVAMFDFTQIPYDGWTSLTFAIIICHCRNMQIRIAEETGLGMPSAEQEEETDDPDL